jgi:hypothetical protein
MALNGANGPPVLNANTWLQMERDSKQKLDDVKEQLERVTTQLAAVMKEMEAKDGKRMASFMAKQFALILRLTLQQHARELKSARGAPYIDVSSGADGFAPNDVGGLSFECATGDRVRSETIKRFNNYPSILKDFLCTLVTGRSSDAANMKHCDEPKEMRKLSRIFHLSQSMMKAVNGKWYKPPLGLMTAQYLKRNKGESQACGQIRCSDEM